MFIGWRPQMISRPGGAEGSADRALSFVHDSGTTFRPAGAGPLGSGVTINMASLWDWRSAWTRRRVQNLIYARRQTNWGLILEVSLEL